MSFPVSQNSDDIFRSFLREYISILLLSRRMLLVCLFFSFFPFLFICFAYKKHSMPLWTRLVQNSQLAQACLKLLDNPLASASAFAITGLQARIITFAVMTQSRVVPQSLSHRMLRSELVVLSGRFGGEVLKEEICHWENSQIVKNPRLLPICSHYFVHTVQDVSSQHCAPATIFACWFCPAIVNFKPGVQKPK